MIARFGSPGRFLAIVELQMKHLVLLASLFSLLLFCRISFAQTAGTGAISGVITDASGAVVPGATVTVTNAATGDTRTVKSTPEGNYSATLLPPGTYSVTVSKEGFKESKHTGIVVSVTETQALTIKLEVGSTSQTVEVSASASILQTESPSLGRVTNGEMVETLPLVTRNFSQIIGLSPGVNAEITNAAQLGRGGAQQTLSASGSSEMDNNFQMNGVGVNDVQESGVFSGGIPVPNPDSIQEFKVQTAAYDASYGRNGGANVNVVTKGGANDFHGSLFEFFRNTALNANDFFRNELGQPRAVLRQNQFGFTFGGPVKKNKLTFFTSFQGTRQANGIAPTCSTVFEEPLLTDTNRTAAGLGALFAGQSGFAGTGGGANVVQANGSNISPQAIAFLNLKLPNGQFLVPNPQARNPGSTNPATAGISAISDPCPFNELEYMVNADWNQSSKSKWEERFFLVNSQSTFTLNTPNSGGPPLLGFATQNPNHFRNLQLSNEYVLTSNLLNQLLLGYNRVWSPTLQSTPFAWSDIGVIAPSGPFNFENSVPQLNIGGAFTAGGNGQLVYDIQNSYSLQDNLSWVKGRHTIRFGGGLEQDQIIYDKYKFYGGLIFVSFPDFLLGEAGGSGPGKNGTPFSNVLETIEIPGVLDRHLRIWNGNLYVQDDMKVTSRLTLNAGLRYERLGDMNELFGRNANFNIYAANPNPPAAGTLQGWEVAGNYPGTPPAGVVVNSGSNLAFLGQGQNTFNPRFGFAWQLPKSNRLVLRGGFGVYHQAISGQPTVQLLTDLPWAELRIQALSPTPTFANPFPGGASTYPSFAHAFYSPATLLSPTAFNPDMRPPTIYHYSMNVQMEIAPNFLWEVGYVGTRGVHLLDIIRTNQAESASAANPIRGITTNTLANIPQRLPVEGFSPASFTQIAPVALSWYNALETSLTKRFSHGLQFLASYTWSRDLATDFNSNSGGNGGTQYGDQHNIAHDYGPDSFVRPQRFVFSGVWQIPTPQRWNSMLKYSLGGWRMSGVLTLQDGQRLGVTNVNATNAFGITTTDFAELSPNCTLSQVNSSGAVEDNLRHFINQSCFGNKNAPLPIVGSDGIATGFGNTGPGIIHGPAQENTDMALAKIIPVKWPNEAAGVEFRVEGFNLFNTPQFSNPVNAVNNATFGQILGTAVAPRIFQFALKLSF